MRIFALAYNPFLWLGEIAGMRGLRRTLLGSARGRVVEIGAGTGLNVELYPDDLDELVLTEPDEAMRRRLTRTLQRTGRVAQILDAPAERLPFADASVDTVVSRLCCAPSPTPNALSARSPVYSAPTARCCLSNTCVQARGSSRRAKMPFSVRGAASPAGVIAIARPQN